ncbi:MAG: hypothetical protein A2919_00360 [Candidatus Spechtbacteria bacterium RIFCSPLOWO2_01_FULL_43_12]|uniref:Fimbrial assembly protein n=1 Tax=Candidatus Spechtbacteria bacterium RIFCSPLOWO2_01_FULL_43_12 TaxID=1802162 RepID=A0A1G2HFE3_9BACT|nr:MAG: hypothetical protein A2919_00360 [Candidatus Spechtbacteria bacterium RIFCSPLOWO2_01_FULL_43_12]
MMQFNLLPKKYQSHFKDEIAARILYTLSIFVVIWMVVLGIVVFASFQFLAVQDQFVQESIESTKFIEETVEAQVFEEKIIGLNRLLLRVEVIMMEEGYDAGFLLEHFAPMLPAGSNLTSFTYSTNSNRIFLKGHADQRTQVIALQNRLEADPLFVDVEAPLSNLLRAEDVDFSFTLTLKDIE